MPGLSLARPAKNGLTNDVVKQRSNAQTDAVDAQTDAVNAQTDVVVPAEAFDLALKVDDEASVSEEVDFYALYASPTTPTESNTSMSSLPDVSQLSLSRGALGTAVSSLEDAIHTHDDADVTVEAQGSCSMQPRCSWLNRLQSIDRFLTQVSNISLAYLVLEFATFTVF